MEAEKKQIFFYLDFIRFKLRDNPILLSKTEIHNGSCVSHHFVDVFNVWRWEIDTEHEHMPCCPVTLTLRNDQTLRWAKMAEEDPHTFVSAICSKHHPLRGTVENPTC